jgi:hypothetical protein
MGNGSTYSKNVQTQSSKKHGVLAGNDVPAALDEEERRPSYAKGRAFCRAMERQSRHSRFGRRGLHL